ncbi:MAG: hypothetical protein ACXVLQ_05165 [Bacteriovorax sp.]
MTKKIYAYWLAAFLLASVLLTFSHFKSSSNDSKYYTDLVIRYHDKNWQDVVTPKWGENFWGFDKDSYMRDQLPGQVIMGVVLTKLGVPPAQSLHILGMAFQILSIFLLSQIALQFTSAHESSVLLYSLLLTPLAFSYNLRANHELGIMFFSFLAIYAGLKLPSRRAWGLLSAISCLGLLWIKGPFFIFGIVLSMIGYFFSPIGPKKISSLIFATLLSGLCVLASALIFEFIYRKLTNESFFLAFWKIQIEQRAINQVRPHSFMVQKALNFFYYFSHYLSYALPWSFLAVLLMAKNMRAFIFSLTHLDFLKNRLAMCFLSSAMAFCLLFSLSDRIAGRYVFPGYYLISAWFILILYNSSERFKKIHSALSRIGLHFIVPSLWFIAFAIHFL